LNPEIAKILADEGKKDPETAAERLLVPAVRRLLDKDLIRGRRVLDAWQYWLLNVDAKGLDDFNALEDYEEFRIINCGLLYVIVRPSYIQHSKALNGYN
jgi:hypothetical protein